MELRIASCRQEVVTFHEGLRLKVLKYWRVGLADWRKKQLKSTDFTIISNNCWGGMIYESYNLPKESPTVGMFFMARDYIEFLSDLKGYVGGIFCQMIRNLLSCMTTYRWQQVLRFLIMML